VRNYAFFGLYIFLFPCFPVANTISKNTLTPLSIARSTMCTLAAEQTSSWLMVDTWEAFQDYQRTAVVLDHFDYEINTVLGGVYTEDGEHRNVKVMLLAGSDLISTMSEPGVWLYADVGLQPGNQVPH
jgi:nicotinic acid mononucleotide adenylyltransferase